MQIEQATVHPIRFHHLLMEGGKEGSIRDQWIVLINKGNVEISSHSTDGSLEASKVRHETKVREREI